MAEDAYIFYKFRNRKTGEINEAVVAIKNVENHDSTLKKYFYIHDYKIVEKRLTRREEYDKWRREKRQALIKNPHKNPI